jgi:hypothetical protein
MSAILQKAALAQHKNASLRNVFILKDVVTRMMSRKDYEAVGAMLAVIDRQRLEQKTNEALCR